MFDTLKRDFKALRKSTPGTRFRDFRKYKKQRRSGKKPVGRIVSFLLGLSLLLGGIAIGWLPGPGGFIALVGLAILSREFPGIATAMDKCELLLRAVYNWFRSQSFWIQATLTIVALLTVATTTWYGYRLLS